MLTSFIRSVATTGQIHLSRSLAVTFAALASVQTTNFSATGTIQTYTVPPNGIQIQVDAAGAQGGTGNTIAGGKGARLVAIFNVTPGETLNVLVGGVGSVGESTGGGGGGGNGGGPIDGNAGTAASDGDSNPGSAGTGGNGGAAANSPCGGGGLGDHAGGGGGSSFSAATASVMTRVRRRLRHHHGD